MSCPSSSNFEGVHALEAPSRIRSIIIVTAGPSERLTALTIREGQLMMLSGAACEESLEVLFALSQGVG
jgi:hypothetical protein